MATALFCFVLDAQAFIDFLQGQQMVSSTYKQTALEDMDKHVVAKTCKSFPNMFSTSMSLFIPLIKQG